MESIIPEGLTYTNVSHLPIVKHFVQRIDLVNVVDSTLESKMELSPGLAVMAMVMDTLSGRSPLYRLKNFFTDKDTELLLGTEVKPERFSDYNIARVLDRLYEAGTQKIFGQIAQNAVETFDIDVHAAHFDTTSISVFGDYDDSGDPFEITYGHSKDHRPDLKQFIISLLCVNRNIPVLGAVKDGNASDKTINNELLSDIGKHMARHGLEPDAFVYVADSAMVTPDNLEKVNKTGTRFVSRLPATYNECGHVVSDAVASGQWTELGTLADTRGTKKRPAAQYRAYEGEVLLYERRYRAVVIHSSAHDKRRQKRIDRQIDQKRKTLEAVCKKATSEPYYCMADAQASGERLIRESLGSLHQVEYQVERVEKYGRGRPGKNKPRTPIGYEYVLSVKIEEDPVAVAPLREEAGCFVLISNVWDKESWSAYEILRIYKEQNGIEKNFGFLKDPVIVNSIFLKKAHRIEVLGLILLIALLVWRLIEHCMRRYIKETDSKITGWKDKPTDRPTSFMLTTKFTNITVFRIGSRRQLGKYLSEVQLEYLNALNIDPDIFIVP